MTPAAAKPRDRFAHALGAARGSAGPYARVFAAFFAPESGRPGVRVDDGPVAVWPGRDPWGKRQHGCALYCDGEPLASCIGRSFAVCREHPLATAASRELRAAVIEQAGRHGLLYTTLTGRDLRRSRPHYGTTSAESVRALTASDSPSAGPPSRQSGPTLTS